MTSWGVYMENYKIITRQEYKINRNQYAEMIKELFKNDKSEIANFKKIIRHLDFIFSDNHQNDSMLILNIEEGKIISMINFLQYNSLENLWSLFSLFTLKTKRKRGYGEKILKYGIKQIKTKQAKLLISGIEPTNIESIKLHEKVGFRNSGKMWNKLADGFPENHMGFIMEF